MINPRLKVLLIDDDEDDYVVIRDMLDELPGQPIALDWEGDYGKAKKLIGEHQHDAFLVDYRLGPHSGLDLIAETVAERASAAPVILLTGKGDHETDVLAMQRGASDYLVKSQLGGPLLERSIRYAVRRADYIQDLREREDATRGIFDATFEGIIVLDLGGKIIDLNQPAARILGDKQTQLLGKSVFKFFPFETANRLVAAAHEVAPKTFKASCTSTQGNCVHLEVSTKSYMHLGLPSILVAFEDVSERMQMEAQILQQDRLASVGLLASSLAHEIGTPLGVMRGRAEIILMHAESDSSVSKNATVIVSQIDRISKLIHSLLTLARGEKVQTVGQTDVLQVLTEVMDLLGHELTRNRIDIEINVPRGVLVKAASGQLHQVFLNLLVNALHAIQSAMKNGRERGHRIRVLAVDDGARWRLGIEDSGCGISEANLQQLFKPFFTTKEIGVGTGLGLATSYRLLEAWNATISAQSKEGVGTTFFISMLKAD